MKRLVDIQGQPLVFSPDSQTAKTDIPQVASRVPEHPASGITLTVPRSVCGRQSTVT